jgi:acetyl esterase/lipase
MKKIILLLMAFISLRGSSQQVILRDTSFTIQSTYEKERKKRSYIEIADPSIPKNVKKQTDISYKKVNGRQLLLDVFYPKNNKKKKPAVLLIFGGGWRSGDKTQNHAMATELAKQGYIAVSAEYRLSLEAAYPAAVADLRDAVRWMRGHAEKYGLDPDKIAVMGCSAGGQLAALLGTTNKLTQFGGQPIDTTRSSVQAILNIDGILAFRHPESAEGAVAAQWLGGTYEQQPGNWEEAAALNHVDASAVPVLFINSSIPRFHAGRDDMIRKLDSSGIYSEVHTIDDTPHPFWFFHPWFERTMQYANIFLKKIFD